MKLEATSNNNKTEAILVFIQRKPRLCPQFCKNCCPTERQPEKERSKQVSSFLTDEIDALATLREEAYSRTSACIASMQGLFKIQQWRIK